MDASKGVNGGHPVVVGITGASGSLLARAAIDVLLDMGVPVIASASSAARMVWREEMDESFGAALERWADSGEFTHYASGDLAAPIASGTFPVRGMAIVPCSMATAAAVAHGFADNLIRRAADVTLKERRPLVMVPRESPLSALHLENLATAARLGAAVIPPGARLLPGAGDHGRRRGLRDAAGAAGAGGDRRAAGGDAVPAPGRVAEPSYRDWGIYATGLASYERDRTGLKPAPTEGQIGA